MSDLPKTVQIMETGPRDGLQIEAKVLSADQRVQLIEALAGAGLREIEIGSFVRPGLVPQMDGTDEVARRLLPREGLRYRALWLNARGLQKALQVSNLYIVGRLTMSSSETFSRRNTNRSIAETLAAMPEWIRLYQEAGVPVVEISVNTAFGCNFEGDVPVERVLGLAAELQQMLADHGCPPPEQLTLADTMGWANPVQIKRTLGQVRERWPELNIKLHLHDTRGTGLSNVAAALEMGVNRFDAAVGGLGGCPFAGHKGAAGNVCTEDVVFLCEEMGVSTGVDLPALIGAAKLAEDMVGHPLPGKLMKSGPLNRPRPA